MAMKTVFLLLSYLALAAPTDAAAMSITVESAKSANEGKRDCSLSRASFCNDLEKCNNELTVDSR